MTITFPYSSAPTRQVKEIQFGVMSPEEIKAFSVAKIEHPEVMDENNRQKVGGLMDPRMGTIDRNFKCQTCLEGMAECPGHFGHIELARPVFHGGFMVKVKKILECICFSCGKLRVDVRDPMVANIVRRVKPQHRLKAIWAIASKRTSCETDERDDENGDATNEAEFQAEKELGVPKGHGGCGADQPLWRKEALKLMAKSKPSTTDKDESGSELEIRSVSPGEIYNVLRKIPAEDLYVMGLNIDYARPEWMILTVMPVPPAAVRPSISIDGGAMRSEDDLTYKLAQILKTSATVRRLEAEGVPPSVVDEQFDLLQFHVATYMDNEIAGLPQDMQKSGRPIKAIRARLKGKEGRMRGNLMGKRVDFSARTVITGDPNLQLDQVGVPKSIAMTLTYPERVTPYNIVYLQTLVNNGPSTYPGARYYVKDTGERIDLKYRKSGEPISLQFGWIVERHLKDGDFVLFNRQPSLHKMSMMCHRVKLMNYSTFRLNLSVTSPYNADFDGDEMNLHVPQSEETRAELSQIAWVPRQIISPQANKPVMGIVQDTLCGIRKFTLRDNYCDWKQVQNILLWLPGWDGTIPTPAILKPKPMWTGKQLMSMTIPKGINITFKNNEKPSPIDITDENVLIDNGEIVHGTIVKNMAGSANNGLVHVIFRELGHVAARDFFSACQMMVNFWLLHYGFSVGIGDTIVDTATMAGITNRMVEAKEAVQRLIAEAEANRMKPKPGMTIRETLEAGIATELNKARDWTGKTAQDNLKEDNNVKQMVVSGAKGSFINISQMTGVVGQQFVEGKRINFGFKHRTLPHFPKDDYGPESRGFVENSYLRGLTPQEFWFHAMGGREGLIDTAVKTAETGYIQRRLVKAMEDLKVAYDGTVRNSTGDVVQFLYGEDGMDGAAMEKQSFDIIRLSDRAFERRYKIDVFGGPGAGFGEKTLAPGIDKSSASLQNLLDDEYRQLREDRQLLRQYIFPDGNPSHPLPANIQRIIQNSQQLFNVTVHTVSDLDPVHLIEMRKGLCDRLVIVRGDDKFSKIHQHNATLLFNILVRSHLATRRILEEHHLTREAFEWVIGEIEQIFNKAVCDPAEMVGTLAAQSIGEPATQMTLNTFHYAGVASKSVTGGVPRLKEIINVAINIRTPALNVYLDREYSQTEKAAHQIMRKLTYTRLRDITASVEIFYDPKLDSTDIEEDKDFVDAFFAIPDEDIKLEQHSPWLLRLELDRAKVLEGGYEMSQVVNAIVDTVGKDVFVIHSEDNAEKLIIRIRVVSDEKEDDQLIGEEDIFLKKIEGTLLDHVELGGITGIQRVFISEGKQTVLSQQGEYDQEREWFLETDGINLKEVLAVDGVDAVRTYSNNCYEVYQTLGIEAGRNALFKELNGVIEMGGSYVNYRHLALLCDLMCSKGQLMSITRHGINRTDAGALSRASFEETVEILLEAAAVGDVDDCHGVAENVLLGQIAPMGTGAFDVSLDLEMLKDVIVDHRLPVQNMMAAGVLSGGMTPGGAMTPYDALSPMWNGQGSVGAAAFSPMQTSNNEESGGFNYMGYGMSPMQGGLSPGGGGGYSPSSPTGYSPTSPFAITSPTYSPSSPYQGNAGSASPWIPRSSTNGGLNITSPAYSPSSPQYSPTSPMYSPASPRFSPSSPTFSPSSPNYSPASPAYGGGGGGLARNSPFSPASPAYSPTSPMGITSPRYSPTSPKYSPASPAFSPTSPVYSPTSPAPFQATSPRYSPNSPTFSPTSPVYSPTSPVYSPASPAFSPTSPAYSPASPAYSPNSPAYSPTSPAAQGSNGQPQTNGQPARKGWGTSGGYGTSPSWKG
ncbi:DNA-directed RNA polymerase II subunit RPB1 [Tremella mesenterica]|uniref:DNA-directed RNA polymerase subunit n=1 Tax=Tremella mesenterica TaxID=5217 RepID=A0A4Q1BT71_TREME|nr:DNA-directed RNA polymerase II subunit RPB1 [Tremella mesenterica]